MSSPLTRATRTERNKVLGFRRPNIVGPKFAGASVLVTALKWTVGLKKGGLTFATPNEKSDDGATCKRSGKKRAERPNCPSRFGLSATYRLRDAN